MKKTIVVILLLLGVLGFQVVSAQMHGGGFIGFKSYSLKAVTAMKGTILNNPYTSPANDAGGTVFNFGATFGYTAVTSSIYNLDLDAVISFSSIGFVERAYNYENGSGAYSAHGYSGGTTKVWEINLLGINRLVFPALKVVEPYAGLGLAMMIYGTGDISYGPPNINQAGTATGSSSFKMGLQIVYGAKFPVLPFMAPYIRFGHLIPFGSEIQSADDAKLSMVTKDVPGYFLLTAGVMFNL